MTIGPAGQQHLHQHERRAFARIVDVLLVSHSQDADLAALDRLAALVEGLDQPLDDVLRHAGVDFAGQLDEPRGQAVLAGHPGEIERIDRNAVPAQPGPG